MFLLTFSSITENVFSRKIRCLLQLSFKEKKIAKGPTLNKKDKFPDFVIIFSPFITVFMKSGYIKFYAIINLELAVCKIMLYTIARYVLMNLYYATYEKSYNCLHIISVTSQCVIQMIFFFNVTIYIILKI